MGTRMAAITNMSFDNHNCYWQCLKYVQDNAIVLFVFKTFKVEFHLEYFILGRETVVNVCLLIGSEVKIRIKIFCL